MDKAEKIIALYGGLVKTIVNHRLYDFMCSNAFKSVAIYGYGRLGRSLHQYLDSMGIDVRYIIDINENIRGFVGPTKVYGEVEKYPVADVVIITPVEDGEKIQDFLVTRVDSPILLLEDLL